MQNENIACKSTNKKLMYLVVKKYFTELLKIINIPDILHISNVRLLLLKLSQENTE